MIDKYTIEINCYDAFQILLFTFGMFFLLWFLFLHLSAQVNYVVFNTDSHHTWAVISIPV